MWKDRPMRDDDTRAAMRVAMTEIRESERYWRLLLKPLEVRTQYGAKWYRVTRYAAGLHVSMVSDDGEKWRTPTRGEPRAVLNYQPADSTYEFGVVDRGQYIEVLKKVTP